MRHRDLPYDVWEHITTFLSSEDTKKLLDVNRALFTIAMNERYRTCTIGSLLETDTRRNLARLTDPEVVFRVRRLIIKPGHICRTQEVAKVKSIIETAPKSTTEIHKKIKASLSGKRMESPVIASSQPGVSTEVAIRDLLSEASAEAAIRDLLSIMGLLKELRSLLIDINKLDHCYFQQAAIPFFTIGWSTFRTSLRSLELRVPMEDLALVLPDLLQGILPNLDTVSVWIMRASSAAQEDVIMVETLLPFLQFHRHTLRSLTVDLAERINVSPLLLALHLPSLTNFKLAQPYFKQGEADYTGLQRFFKTHRSHLTHFEIVTGAPAVIDMAYHRYPFFSQECFTVPLPRLEHLSIDGMSDVYSGGISPNSVTSYIHQFKSTLVSLKLADTREFVLSSLKLLVEGFASSARLRRLDIPPVFFEPELLTVLATNLPNLEVLNISISIVTPRGEVFPPHMRDPHMPIIALEIRALSFPHWRLRSLNLQVAGAGTDASTALYYLEKDHFRAALLEALPNVQVFCGLSRDKYYSS